jgi:hypothetical protein
MVIDIRGCDQDHAARAIPALDPQVEGIAHNDG